MKTGNSIILVLGLLLSACSVSVSGLDPNAIGQNDNNNNGAGQTISFKSQVLPIFSQDFKGSKCTSCHSGSPAIGNLNLNDKEKTPKEIYDGLLFGRIDEVTPEESELLTRATGKEHNLIFASSDTAYKTILTWINAGAPFDDIVPTPVPGDKPDNPNPTPTPVANPSFFATNIYPRLLGNCSSCHRPGGIFAAFDVTAGGTAASVCASIKAYKPNVVVNPASATGSTLYSKPINGPHQGGIIWSAGTEGALLTQWITQKAASCVTP